MYSEVVLLHGVEDLDALTVLSFDITGISNLTAHLCVERSAVKHKLEEFLVFLLDGALLEEAGAGDAEGVVTLKHYIGLIEHHPVSEFVGGGVAGALLLLLKLYVEVLDVYGEALFCGNQFRKVYGEAVGVVEYKGVRSGNDLGRGVFGHIVLKHPDTAVQGAQEGVFFLLDNVGDKRLLGLELRIGFSHIGHKLGDEAAKERLREAKEGVAVTHCAAEDAADNVAGLHVGRKLAVGD